MKKAYLILCLLILLVFVQGCRNYNNYSDDVITENNTISDEYLESKLTAHTWESYSVQLSSYIRYTFNTDGTYTYERETPSTGKVKHSKGSWFVRDETLCYKSKSIYSDGDTKESIYVTLEEDDVAADMLAIEENEFYVSDDYFVWCGVRYTPYEDEMEYNNNNTF